MDDPMADELRTYWTDPQFDRDDVLLAAAQDHAWHGRSDRAVAIWRQLIREGGEDAGFAHVAYAEHLFFLGHDDEALNELEAVIAEGRIFSFPWQLTAEMLEERGDLANALLLYRTATSCLTSEELSIRNGPSWAREVRAGQRRVKWRMGIPLDEADLLAEMGEDESEDKEGDVLELLAAPEVVEGRLQFWARSEFDESRISWAARRGANDAVAYYEDVERALRAHPGGIRILVAPRDRYNWMRLLDVAYEARFMLELRSIVGRHDDGTYIAWPPGRNQPCWCGSGTKYKKCCGSNGPPM
jgi:tetratricopeptide (TPR) repeat protein